MTEEKTRPEGRVLVLGSTGFVGSRLVPLLLKEGVPLRLLVRDPAKVRRLVPDGSDVEIVRGDLIAGDGVRESVRGVTAAYYLVHSMGGKSLFKNKDFAELDRKAALNFIKAAGDEGVSRVIYLGGLGETGDNLSEHLRSRQEIGRILSSGKPAATVLRAAIIIGAGGSSYEMLRYLVERLPIMVCPRWIDTKIQPIAVRDVLAYLVGCLFSPDTAGKTFDIGGPDVMTYREMMQQFAEVRGLARRFIITVPLLTPILSAYWVDLVTPIPSGIAHPLIEGLKNEVICRDDSIDRSVRIEKTSFREAIRIALHEAKG